MTAALQTIRIEHYNYRSVLRCLRRLLERLEERQDGKQRALLFAILDYIEAFPATFHHPKEEAYVFATLRRRRPESAPLLDRLEREHAEMLDRIGEFRAACEAFRADPRAAAQVREIGLRFITSERAHIMREEREVLPLAIKALSEDDWQVINRAFARDEDPLFGPARTKRFERLFAWILDDTAEALTDAARDAEPGLTA